MAGWTRLTGRSLWVVTMFLSASIISACGSIGPTTVNRDRFDYITAISESWKEQTLLNIVKLRYADVPVFMEVGQVISGYELEGTVSAGGTLGDKDWRNAGGALGTFASIGAGGRYLDRPTITYAPLTGADFVKTMMTPFPPGAVMFLVDAGWPVDLLLQVSTQAINGLRNYRGGPSGHPADPEFLEVIRLLKRIQASGGVGVKMQREKEKEDANILLFQTRRMTPEIAKDVAEVKRLLRLNPDATDIRITYGADSQGGQEIALHTRSGYQVLIELASLVSVPPEHIAERRTYGSAVATPDSAAPSQVAAIRSGAERPADSFAQVKYRGHWYWIDDRDFLTKRIFTFMTVLFTLSETGQKIQQPILTIRAN
ncbi:MAG: hypothetical protein L0H94_00110 [Nitrospira sp.]|nr:hypothetical protein [Nitrospira sp.]